MGNRSRRSGESAPRSPGKVIAAVVGVIVIAAAAVAIGGSGSDDAGAPSVTDTVAPGETIPVGTAAEFQPVSVSGTPLAPLGEGPEDPAKGAAVPVVTGRTHAGQEVVIDPAGTNQATMLVFLAHWCPHCNREVPQLIEWREAGLVPENLRIVGVTTGSRDDQPNWPPSAWLESFAWPWEAIADSETQDAARAYGVDGFPFVAVVDATGRVAARWSGERGVEEINRLVTEALART